MFIMISQGAMALGGVIWGSAATIAGASSTLLWAAVLFLGSLVLARRLSINVAENLQQKVPGVLSNRDGSKEVTPMALTEEFVAA
jgi:Transmembrane secretion effector